MSETAQNSHRELIYVADPMCSWCWGFAPVIKAIARLIAAHQPAPGLAKPGLTPIMGGLRPLTRKAMNDDDKASIRHHWEEVAKRSGQPFDMTFFERDGFVYDTEPACRAVCLVRRLAPGLSFDYLERVQRAFYAEGSDVTDPDILAALAFDVAGIEPDEFRTAFNDVAIVYETAGDFHAARQLGVSGYPTVILQSGQELALLTQGYQPFDALEDAVEQWLSGTLETQKAG
ncbi:MAG: DsbA family protein [Rhodospirillales bacterium]